MYTTPIKCTPVKSDKYIPHQLTPTTASTSRDKHFSILKMMSIYIFITDSKCLGTPNRKNSLLLQQ